MTMTELVLTQEDQHLASPPFTTYLSRNVQMALTFRSVPDARPRRAIQVKSQTQRTPLTPSCPITGSVTDNASHEHDVSPHTELSLSPSAGYRHCACSFCKAKSKPAFSRVRDESPNHQHNDVKPPRVNQAYTPSTTSSKCCSPSHAVQSLGEPRTLVEVQELFVRGCSSDESAPRLPWWNGSLKNELWTITSRIIELNQRGYLTINSQPAVNGVKSEHEIYGWGQKGGYVYQKAYVEFFVSPDHLPTLIQRLGCRPHFTFVAANEAGDLQTNLPTSRRGDRCSNVVAWGVFPDCEIVQRTVIDLVSFVQWKEEALELWRLWGLGYPEASKARALLEAISKEWYLVNVVNDDYHDADGLFAFFEEKEGRSTQDELR
ncbi:unnamed protein product [Mortierella alpina]